MVFYFAPAAPGLGSDFFFASSSSVVARSLGPRLTDMSADLLEMFGWIVDAFAGWRYLFSRSYRQHTHQRWKVKGRGQASIDIIFGALGILLTLFLLWLPIDSLCAAI